MGVSALESVLVLTPGPTPVLAFSLALDTFDFCLAIFFSAGTGSA